MSEKAAMGRVRDIGLAAGLRLPDNCFRHSYLPYPIALTGNGHQTTTRAGTSVARIDKHYRRPVFAETGEHVDFGRPRPVTKTIAAASFAMAPSARKKLALLPDRRTSRERVSCPTFSRHGGDSSSAFLRWPTGSVSGVAKKAKSAYSVRSVEFANGFLRVMKCLVSTRASRFPTLCVQQLRNTHIGETWDRSLNPLERRDLKIFG